MLTIGNHQFWFRRFPKLPFRERYEQIGKVAESKSFIEVGCEYTYQLKTYYIGIGRMVLTYLHFVPEFCPDWVKLPEAVPPPPPRGKLSVVKDG